MHMELVETGDDGDDIIHAPELGRIDRRDTRPSLEGPPDTPEFTDGEEEEWEEMWEEAEAQELSDTDAELDDDPESDDQSCRVMSEEEVLTDI